MLMLITGPMIVRKNGAMDALSAMINLPGSSPSWVERRKWMRTSSARSCGRRDIEKMDLNVIAVANSEEVGGSERITIGFLLSILINIKFSTRISEEIRLISDITPESCHLDELSRFIRATIRRPFHRSPSAGTFPVHSRLIS